MYLDLGRNQNVVPGQICTVYRVEGKYKQTDEFYPTNPVRQLQREVGARPKEASRAATAKREIPRIILGEAVIIQVLTTPPRPR